MKIDRIGEVNINNQGYKMTIIAYRNKNDIDIVFENNGYIAEHRTYCNFKHGRIKNSFAPSLCGIGYLGNTSSVDENGKKKKSYKCWVGMVRRCYDPKTQEKHPTYINCKVAEEWLCYANFERFYNEYHYELENEEVELDKDILIKGNKIYSSRTCRFVPSSINTLIINGTHSIKTNNLPMGVYWSKENKKYRAMIKIDNKKKHLGLFNSIEEASEAYKQTKKREIIRKANQYKHVLDEDVYEALLEWEVEEDLGKVA